MNNKFGLDFQIIPHYHDCTVPLSLEISIDNKTYFSSTINKERIVSIDVSDDQAHKIKLIMSNKVDATSYLEINLFSQDFNITGFLSKLGKTVGLYTHNFNGNGDFVTELFDSYMGCNGTVEIDINEPPIIWLLSNCGI
jgi:hypothetical protein